MNAEIIAVGTELLLGDILNTNAQFLAKELSAIGINVFYQGVVGDNPERLQNILQTSLLRSDIVITTGGLGPTCDDLTKVVAADVLGLSLVEDKKSLKYMEDFFKKINRPMTENNKKQALFPKGAVIFKNDFGTAPGFASEKDGKVLIMLPGPPREMEPMFKNYVSPFLSKKTDEIIVSRQIRVFGMGESVVEEKLRDIMLTGNPSLAPYAKSGEVELRVTAKAKDKKTALNMITPVIEEVKSRIGDYIYGIDVNSLQERVADLLKEKGLIIATAESCTGGYLSKRITDITGASQVFECGVISYANVIKRDVLGVKKGTLQKFGAVSRQTAFEMLRGILMLSGADIGVSITGIAGPDGGTSEKPVGLIYIGVGNGEISMVKKLNIGSKMRDREYIRYLATSNALDMVIKFIENMY